MKKFLENDWQKQLDPFFATEHYQKLREFLKQEYHNTQVFPKPDEIYAALKLTDFNDVKVCILGQDPYHNVGQANGLAFSVHKDIAIPPSLQNIYQELENDLGIPKASHGDLTAWAKQGVLLLNTVLTVKAHQANSHRGKGWEELTDYVIAKLNERQQPVVFILWGAASIKKKALIDTTKHAVITSPHPSPLSAYRGFFGSKPFSKANDYLEQWGITSVDWRIE